MPINGTSSYFCSLKYKDYFLPAEPVRLRNTAPKSSNNLRMVKSTMCEHVYLLWRSWLIVFKSNSIWHTLHYFLDLHQHTNDLWNGKWSGYETSVVIMRHRISLFRNPPFPSFSFEGTKSERLSKVNMVFDVKFA